MKSWKRFTWSLWFSTYQRAVRPHFYHCFNLIDSPGSSHNSGWHEHPRKLQYADHTHWGSAPVTWGDGSGVSSRPTNCWHGQGRLPGGYLQQDDELDKWHCGGRTHTFSRKIQSVDATQAPWMGGKREEKFTTCTTRLQLCSPQLRNSPSSPT